jgi:hypothetical protein
MPQMETEEVGARRVVACARPVIAIAWLFKLVRNGRSRNATTAQIVQLTYDEGQVAIACPETRTRSTGKGNNTAYEEVRRSGSVRSPYYFLFRLLRTTTGSSEGCRPQLAPTKHGG